MKKTPAFLTAALVLAGCSSVALVQKDEWDRQKADIREMKIEVQRLKAEIEKNTRDQAQLLKLIKADMGALFSDLKTSVSRVSGQLEESQYDLKNLSKTAEKLSERKYILKGGAAGDSAGGDSVIVADKVDVQKLFKIARADFNAKDYGRAFREFEEIIAKFPQDALAGDCRYWAGECLYVQKKYAEAAAEYRKVVQDTPASGSGAPALYKTGLCYEKLKDPKNAKKAFQELIEKYPQSDEAGLARARQGK